MDRIIRRFFLTLGVVLTGLGVVLALELHDLSLPAWKAKGFWAFTIVGLGSVTISWRGQPAVLKKMFLLLCGCGLMEMLLQVTAWLGILPAVNTKERLPWGRVYWTGEGLGNSIRNRYGWYFPEFELARTNRTAVIGDSFVEAVEVHRTRNMAALLGKKLAAQEDPRTVLGLGNHGTGPAHYLEVLRYAHHRFGIQEAIVVLYLGNDITDCTARPPIQGMPPYYAFGIDGRLRLDPAGEAARARYLEQFDLQHRSPALFLPRLIVSHCMLAQVSWSVRNTLVQRKRMKLQASLNGGVEAETAGLGLKAEPFALNLSPEALEGRAVFEGLLGEISNFAGSNHIRLHLVTVPFFPQDFYANKGTNWNGKLGEYDFLAPDRRLVSWAGRRNIPLLALADEMKRRQMTTEQIRALYLSKGSGHFSEAGHRLAAEAIQKAFYQSARASAGLP